MRRHELAAELWQRDAIVEHAAIWPEHEASCETTGAIEADAQLGPDPRIRLTGQHRADALGAQARLTHQRVAVEPDMADALDAKARLTHRRVAVEPDMAEALDIEARLTHRRVVVEPDVA